LALCIRKDQESLKKEIQKTRLRVKKVIWLKQEKAKKEKQAKIQADIMVITEALQEIYGYNRAY